MATRETKTQAPKRTAQRKLEVTAAPPPGKTLKGAVGKALVTGGRALIDPRAAIGEMAVRLGEGLLAGADRLQWFVVRIDDEGLTKTFGFVSRGDAQAFFDGTAKAFPRQYLCKCVAGPAG
jgi:hypothetical protein